MLWSMSTSVSPDESQATDANSEPGVAPPPVTTSDAQPDVQTFKAALGWTFFDPANLLCILLLTSAAVLCFTEMQMVGQRAAWTVLLYYACLAGFLRGYFFYYYYGGQFGRVMVYLGLFTAITVGAAYWEDASIGFHFVDAGQKRFKPASGALHWSALLHVMSGVCLTVHLLIPRRWLIRMTDDIMERVPEK